MPALLSDRSGPRAGHVPRILVADDEAEIRELIAEVLETEGYEVETVASGAELIRRAQEQVPDLLLIDLMMPHIDGYEAIRQLRNDTRTSHLPMLILTAQSSSGEVVRGFESGADDFIAKPFELPVLLARIRAQLKRATRLPAHNPLTGLPGNPLIAEEVQRRLTQSQPFALLYIDLDHFKVFNDTYGFVRGDQVILLLADLLQSTAAHQNATIFVGHIGGDDFAILSDPSLADEICAELVSAFETQVRALYDEADLERGYLRGIDRHGVPRRFPMMTLSIGVVSSAERSFASYEELGRVAAEMKQRAKQLSGSSVASLASIGRQESGSEERQVVLLIGHDQALRRLLSVVLQNEGYQVQQAQTLDEVTPADLEHAALISLEAGERLNPAVIRELRERYPAVPLVLLSTRAEDEDLGFFAGISAFLMQPFQVQQYVACVTQILRSGP